MKPILAILALILVITVNAQKPPTTGGPKGVKEAQQDTQQVSDATLKKLEATYTATKASYDKNPKDAKLKKKYVDATYAVGLGRMYSVSLPPRLKYTSALTAFREVLKADPKHGGAKKDYKMIADIYTKMGKAVPGEK